MKVINWIKEFTVFTLKSSWFKIIGFILIVYMMYCITDLANVHEQIYVELNRQLANQEITYDQAEFIRSAHHEQILYQIAMALIVVIFIMVVLIMEQNSKLRDKVEKVDFRLWEIDRSINLVYLQQKNRRLEEKLERLKAELQYQDYEDEIEYEDDLDYEDEIDHLELNDDEYEDEYSHKEERKDRKLNK